MKFYIASGVENAKIVSELAAIMKADGHTHTYDWTQTLNHNNDDSELKALAYAEVKGVQDAEILIVILPGGRGTHTEIGIAIASEIPIVIYGSSPDAYIVNGQKNPFYYYKHITIHFGEFEQFINKLLSSLKYSLLLTKAFNSIFRKMAISQY